MDVALLSFLLTLNIFHYFSTASIVDFEQVNVYWVDLCTANNHYNLDHQV